MLSAATKKSIQMPRTRAKSQRELPLPLSFPRALRLALPRRPSVARSRSLARVGRGFGADGDACAAAFLLLLLCSTVVGGQKLVRSLPLLALSPADSLPLSLSVAPQKNCLWFFLHLAFCRLPPRRRRLLSNFDLISGFLLEWLFFSLDFGHE